MNRNILILNKSNKINNLLIIKSKTNKNQGRSKVEHSTISNRFPYLPLNPPLYYSCS